MPRETCVQARGNEDTRAMRAKEAHDETRRGPNTAMRMAGLPASPWGQAFKNR